MSGTFSVPVSEARGFVAVPAEIDRLAIVLGCSSAGSGLSSFYLSGQSARAAVGYGDATDTLCQIIEQKVPAGNGLKYPAAMYTVPADEDGSYGAVDDSGVTGAVTCDVDDAVTPYGTYEAWWKCVNGGIVGVAGITYRTSLDGGRNWSRITALGTASYTTIADGNVKFTFAPDSANLSELNTLIDEIRTDLNAHEVDITGSPQIHGATGIANNVSGALPAATTTATRIALVNAERASYEAHRVNVLGGIHGGSDTVDVCTKPIAVDDSTALVLALELKRVLNLHRAKTSGSVHGSADSGHEVTSPAPDAAAIIANDVVRVRTIAPTVASSDIDDAATALARSSARFALVVCDFDCDAALAVSLSSLRSTLLAAGKRVTVLARPRIPDAETSESNAAWNTDIAADFNAFEDSTILFRAEYGLVTDAMTSRQYFRSDLQQFAADVVRVSISTWPNAPADRPEANFTLVDSTGATVGHDEGPRGTSTGLSNDDLGNRFSSAMRLPDTERLESVYSCVPWVMYAADERIRNLMVRRIAVAIERTAVTAGESALGGKLFYTPATLTASATLAPASVRAIQSVIFRALSSTFKDHIQNYRNAALDTGLVQVNPAVTVSGGNLLTVSVTLAPLVFGYLLSLPITLAVQQ